MDRIRTGLTTVKVSIGLISDTARAVIIELSSPPLKKELTGTSDSNRLVTAFCTIVLTQDALS